MSGRLARCASERRLKFREVDGHENANHVGPRTRRTIAETVSVRDVQRAGPYRRLSGPIRRRPIEARDELRDRHRVAVREVSEETRGSLGFCSCNHRGAHGEHVLRAATRKYTGGHFPLPLLFCHPRPRLRREAGACQRRRAPARCGHRSRHRDLRRRNRAGTRSQSRLARAHRSPSHAHEVMPARLLPRDRYESAHITPSTAGGRPEPPQAGRTRRHRRPKNP